MQKTKGVILGIVAVLLLAVLFGSQSTLFKGSFGRPQPPVTLTKNNSFADQNVSPGASNTRLGSWVLKTASDTTLMLSNLTVTTSPGKSVITDVSVRVRNVAFGTTVSDLSSGRANFSAATPVSIGKGAHTILDVYGNIADKYKPLPDNIILNLSASGLLYGTKPFQTPSVSAQGITVSVPRQPASLAVTKDSTSPIGTVDSGAADVAFATFRLSATGGDVEINSLGIDFNADEGSITSSTTCTHSAACDLTGTVRAVIETPSGATTVLSFPADNGGLWDGNYNHYTQLSTYFTVQKDTSVLLKIIGNVHATNVLSGDTFIASLENIGYRDVVSGEQKVALSQTFLHGNRLEVSGTRTLTVTLDPLMIPLERTVQAGGQRQLIAAFHVNNSAATSVNIVNVSLGLTTGEGGSMGSYTNLRLCKALSGCVGLDDYGNIATPRAQDNNFDPDLIIPARGTTAFYVYVDVGATAQGTLIASLNTGDVGARMGSNGIPNVPPAPLNLQTLRIHSNSLAVHKDTSSRAGSLSPGESDVAFATFLLSAREDVELESLGIEFNADNGTIDSTTVCPAPAMCDLNGSVWIVVVPLDNTPRATVLSYTSSVPGLWDSTADDAVTLSTRYTIRANTSVELKIIGNVHQTNARDGETFIASVESIGYKRLGNNVTEVASQNAFVNGNTLTVEAP